MKLIDIRFLILLIAMANAIIASSQTYFSVEKINRQDFEKARNCKEKCVYDLRGDSIVENNITNKILLNAKIRFGKLDAKQLDNYDIGTDQDDYNNLFSIKSLIFIKQLGLYWFLLPSIHDYESYCYDKSGKFLGEMLMPFAVSPNGIMVSQNGFDCDGYLHLHFYKQVSGTFWEFMTFQDRRVSINYINDYYTGLENNLLSTSFWVGDNQLFISFQTPESEQVYLRIILPENK